MNSHFKTAMENFQISINNCKPNSSGHFSHEDANTVNLNLGLEHLALALREELDSLGNRLAVLEKRLPQR